ncbi:zinc-binding dehydrogenase [Pseudomonadales bacterium]|nr:zinc-binding dehydrogenase [Pseudomonadales bacterium]
MKYKEKTKVELFRAAILREQNPALKLSLVELYRRDPLPGEVEVRMISAGLCGAQVNEILGKKGPDKFLPHLMGHEGYGEVIAVGEGVSTVSVGDHVVLHWRKGAGRDLPGIGLNSSQHEKIGGGPVTTFSEYTYVSENRCTSVPDDIDLRSIYPLLGCALPTAFGAISREARVGPEDKVVIIGCGGLGAALAFWCDLLRVRSITIVDVHPEKAEVARDFGASYLSKNELLDSDESYDVVFETTGSTEMIESAFDVLAKAGRLCLIGQPKLGESVTLRNFLKVYDGIRLFPSMGGGFSPENEMQNLVELLINNKGKASKLISHKINIDQINDGFQKMKEADCRRVILEFDHAG